jgi:hypothetical protein
VTRLALLALVMFFLAGGCGGGGELTVAPPQFAAAAGWHVGQTRAQTCVGVSRTRCVQAEAWASTVRYRDCANCTPPHETLAVLPPDGIVIQVTNSREVPAYGTLGGWPPRLRASQAVGPFEGEPPRFSVIQLYPRERSGVDHSLFVWFGRARPTDQQLARANAELRTVDP